MFSFLFFIVLFSCQGPWQDPMYNSRNVLSPAGPEFTFGTTACADGFQGNMDSFDNFVTCHNQIFVPTQAQRDSIPLIVSMTIIFFFGSVFWFFLRRRLHKRYMLAKIERRRSRRSSEDSITQMKKGAFANK